MFIHVSHKASEAPQWGLLSAANCLPPGGHSCLCLKDPHNRALCSSCLPVQHQKPCPCAWTHFLLLEGALANSHLRRLKPPCSSIGLCPWSSSSLGLPPPQPLCFLLGSVSSSEVPGAVPAASHSACAGHTQELSHSLNNDTPQTLLYQFRHPAPGSQNPQGLAGEKRGARVSQLRQTGSCRFLSGLTRDKNHL